MNKKSLLPALTKPQIPYPVVIALGNFDGLHLGHQVLLKKAQEMAQQLSGECRPMVISFDPHPAALLKPPHHPLMSLEQKKTRLNELGLSAIWIVPFTKELSQLSAELFIEQILLKNLDIKGVVVGFNFRFGHERRGDTELLKKYLVPLGIKVEVVDPVNQSGSADQLISTTRIKQALKEGQMEQVQQSLGSAYTMSGLVVRGQGRGHKIGIPTINLNQVLTMLPKEGVYYTLMRKIDEPLQWYQSVTNVGPQPTFDQPTIRIETHVLDFNQMIYGQQVEIKFIKWIRAVRRFASLQELVEQIKQDIHFAQEQVGGTG